MKGKTNTVGLIPNNVIRIPTTIQGNLFRYWFEFLKPFHKLTSGEMEVATALVKSRYNLSKEISNSTILDAHVMSELNLKQIREECNIKPQHFQVKLSKLRKAGLLIDNKINPKFIPNIIEENGTFVLAIILDFKNEK